MHALGDATGAQSTINCNSIESINNAQNVRIAAIYIDNNNER